MDSQDRCSINQRSFLLLAPAAPTEAFIGQITHSNELHDKFVARTQRLRGRIYVEDGAIPASLLTSDGRHVQDIDNDSWHLLTVDRGYNVLGCTRFRRYSNNVSYNQLGVRHAPIAKSEPWATKLRAAIDAELDSARQAGFSYVEVGGWALSEELRGTTEALHSVLATYAWSQLLGGALGISTATNRNGSASILRRLGGRPLQWDGASLPPYYDERHKCEMEMLRFDSRLPNPKYQTLIDRLRSQIALLPVICREERSTRYSDLIPSFPPHARTPAVSRGPAAVLA